MENGTMKLDHLQEYEVFKLFLLEFLVVLAVLMTIVIV